MINLTKLEELAKEATPGKWEHGVHSYHDFVKVDSGLIADGLYSGDAAFITSANPATILALVKVCRAAKKCSDDPYCKALRELQEALKEISE